MSEGTTPPMPATQAEWEAHWAFYRLTVAQRDRAWAEVRELRQLLERLGPRMHFTLGGDTKDTGYGHIY